ncbi:MAG: hypothetical protein FD177_227 [Desulfovibrionaceae bacterium]|nr:MAG: hypothetical protein FD177_227 [Desulfovibrionaceae bacterium]
MSGGGEPTYSVDDMNAAIGKIKPPKSVYDPELPSFMQGGINSEEESRALDTHYRNESFKAAQNLQGPTPQEQTQEAMRLIVRESAADRIPDPVYDLTPRDAASYDKMDFAALAAQRARDYADDMAASMQAKGEEMAKAERDKLIASREAEELKRLKESKATAEEMTKARDERRTRLLMGKQKLKAGSSLLSDEETGSGSTLLTG